MVVGARHTKRATKHGQADGLSLAGDLDAKDRIRQQRGNDQQEDQGQGSQQNCQGNFVGGLLSLGSFDHRNHAIQKALAGKRRHLNDQPVGYDSCSPCDRTAIAAAFSHDRSTLTGDGTLIDRSDAFDHFAVGRNRFAGFDNHDVADL